MKKPETMAEAKDRVNKMFDMMVGQGIDAKQPPFEIAYLDRVVRVHSLILAEAIFDESKIACSPDTASAAMESALAFMVHNLITNIAEPGDIEGAVTMANKFLQNMTVYLTDYLNTHFKQGAAH